MRFPIWLSVILFSGCVVSIVFGKMTRPPQEPRACDDGWVRVWEDSRYVCEPEQKTVAVFESECIARIEITKDSRILMGMDYHGKLDKDDWSSQGLKLTLVDGCKPHYERVKVHQ